MFDFLGKKRITDFAKAIPLHELRKQAKIVIIDDDPNAFPVELLKKELDLSAIVLILLKHLLLKTLKICNLLKKKIKLELLFYRLLILKHALKPSSKNFLFYVNGLLLLMKL